MVLFIPQYIGLKGIKMFIMNSRWWRHNAGLKLHQNPHWQFFMHICLQKSMCTFKKQQTIYINDESYNDWYFPTIWSCFSGVHTFSHSKICLKKAWKILKFDVFFNKVNFMPFCCYDNAVKLKIYYVFLDASYRSLHIHHNNFHNLNFKFLSNFRPKTAFNAPTPFMATGYTFEKTKTWVHN